MKKYIHKIWYVEDGRLGRVFGTIETKKRFKEALIDHFFNGSGEALAFQLLDSPNTRIYNIVPYLNKNDNPDICFSVFKEPPMSESELLEQISPAFSPDPF